MITYMQTFLGGEKTSPDLVHILDNMIVKD